MFETSTVTVYNFRVVEGNSETPRVAAFKATRQAIEREFGGEVLEGTAEHIDAGELDHEGRYHRVPTGWGELR